MRRRRRARLLRIGVPDAVVLLTLGTIGIVGLVYWRDRYSALITIQIALIILYVILRG